MEERFAVTAATGAMGPVLKKLTALLGDEYKLQDGTRRDIESINPELEPVHDLLGKLRGRSDLDVACKNWMTEARELSYDMEDGIDSFTDGLERDDGAGSFIQRGGTVSPFKEFMERVKGVSQRRGEMQKIGDTIICNRSKPTTDPRAHFLHKDPSELVGMDEKVDEVIELLQGNEMVCICGPFGMGKTTLADLVYRTIRDQFQCGAFVSVHPNPNMMDILGSILSQVTDGAMSPGSGTEPAAEQNIVNDKSISITENSGEKNDLIKGISTFLFEKRFLVIIDDIWHWEEWEVIRKALPKNNLGCKLIMTTRMDSIVWKCKTEEQDACEYKLEFYLEDAERLSAMRLSQSVEGASAIGMSTEIADMCGLPPFHSCPLAVICLSSAWADWQQGGGDGEWEPWANHVLGDGFLSTPALKPMVQSLCHGFDDLPAQLRTCLLYCAVYPLGYVIDRGCMVRKWIAEGFVSQVEVADSYLEELVSRNLLERHMWMHAVHPIMRAFLMCEAKEDNFIACHDGTSGNYSHAKLQIRRLSSSTDRFPDEDLLSHTRSLVVSGYQCQLNGVPFKAFKKLRVLEICNSSHLGNDHLVDVCGLIWLKYLGILFCDQITELPREIGRLQNLVSLHVAGTRISKLPTETGDLESLETLDISETLVRELPKEIVKLRHLRTLDVRGTKVRELPWEVQNSINVHVGEPHHGTMVRLPEAVSPDWVISSSGANWRAALSMVFFHPFDARCEEPVQVPLLRVDGRHLNVPRWIKQDLRYVSSLNISLCKLGEDDLQFLKQMPNLRAMALRIEVLPPKKPVAITATGGRFSKLETFYVDCRLPRVITFKEGAMPKLKHLEFKFYTGGSARQDYSMGIMHLPSLEKVVFRCSENYKSDSPGISEAIDAVRKEAAEHPNKITLWVVGKEREVLGRGGSGIRPVVKAIVEKEFQGWKNEAKNRKREIEEKAVHICRQRHRLLTAVERRAEQEKNNAVIDKEIRDQFALLLERNDAGRQECNEWEKETRRREIEERVGRARDQSLRLLTEAEKPVELKKNNAEIKIEIQDTISMLEKSFAENMKK